MRYRLLGRTGLTVSELGLGGHEFARFLPSWHFVTNRKFEEPVPEAELDATQPARNALIQTAIAAGVNYFDTGEVAEPQSLGLALATLGRRQDVYVAAETMNPVQMLREIPSAQWRDALLDGVAERLRLLRTDHIDVFNVHEVADGYARNRFEFVMATLQELQGQGQIRALGVADHHPRFLAELIRKYDCFDTVMIPYNYHQQEARDVLFPLCKALNIGVVVMKPFNWPYYGLPFTHFCPSDLVAGGYTPAQLSLRWILTAPEVSTIVPGTNTLAELAENVAAFTHDHAVDDAVLKRILAFALSTRGKARLRQLGADADVARTRAYIRGYSKRALAGTV
jgi:aryl-alcohol dehydrogenase-like predicted oxidoreductase